MKTDRTTSGFTLVEVLLLITLVGLLLTVALPNSLRAHKNSDAHHCRANLEDIQSTIGAWDSNESIEQKIRKYLDKGEVRCPSGGRYILVGAGQEPTCAVEGHSLVREGE
jgi:type II secretory pathway pseudopilin PulG